MQLLDDYTIAHIVESMIPIAVRDGIYDETISDVMCDLCKLARTSKRMHDVVGPIIRKYASMSLLHKSHSDGVMYEYVNYRGWNHRVDGPAVELADGTRKWCLYGLFHRVDGPAVELADGTREWFLNGKRHREDGPAVELVDGTREWYLHGKLHREDGHAVEWADGTRKWYREGKLHREDGPAIERTDGKLEWYYDGILVRSGRKRIVSHEWAQYV